MNRLQGTLLSILALFMVAFISIGYAAISDTLTIGGQAAVEPKPYRGVYIKNVEVVKVLGAVCNESSFALPTIHNTTVDAVASGGSVTYKITVHNNTDVVYWYVDEKYENVHQNGLISQNGGITIVTKDRMDDTYQTFNSDDWVPPQTERDFYVTYTYGANAQVACKTMVNFHFDIKMDAVHDEFLAVLNDHKETATYDYLVSVFEAEYKANGSKDITTESHPEVFANLFGDLVVNIGGVESTAKIVIRRENLDNDTTTGDNGTNNTGCEYTLYITLEPLTPGTRPTVYAIAYSEGAKSMGDDWYQVGELYEGTAPVLADGTIDYKNWIASPKKYEIADGIDYNVGMQNGDQYDIMKTMEQLISAEDQDVFNQIDNTKIFKKVYDIVQANIYSSDPAVIGLRVAFTDASKFYVNHNNGQEFKVVRNTYTRAEIIYALKNIQQALDYYYQVFTN